MTVICADPRWLYAILPAWTAVWVVIGYWTGARGKPKRYVLIEDGGAWTSAKLHHVDSRDDDAPTKLEESQTSEKSAGG